MRLIKFLTIVGCVLCMCVNGTEKKCPESTTVDIADRGNFGIFPSVAITEDKFPVISYWDITNDNVTLKMVHCNSATCSSSASTSLVMLGTNSAGETCIAIGRDNFPIIAYSYGEILAVIHCTSSSCSSFEQPVVVTNGRNCSIAIASDGFPIVSYYNESSLNILHCKSNNCSSYYTPIHLDNAIGASASVAIIDSCPIISYQKGDILAVVHCGSPNCCVVLLFFSCRFCLFWLL